ncbi:hypothetical protein Tco_0078673 [Tanacetum coccineum]
MAKGNGSGAMAQSGGWMLLIAGGEKEGVGCCEMIFSTCAMGESVQKGPGCEIHLPAVYGEPGGERRISAAMGHMNVWDGLEMERLCLNGGGGNCTQVRTQMKVAMRFYTIRGYKLRLGEFSEMKGDVWYTEGDASSAETFIQEGWVVMGESLRSGGLLLLCAVRSWQCLRTPVGNILCALDKFADKRYDRAMRSRAQEDGRYDRGVVEGEARDSSWGGMGVNELLKAGAAGGIGVEVCYKWRIGARGGRLIVDWVPGESIDVLAGLLRWRIGIDSGVRRWWNRRGKCGLE